MYSSRLQTLTKAYTSAERDNKIYNEALKEQALQQQQLDFLVGMQNQLKSFDLAVTTKESEWRETILDVLTNEIVSALAYVFPTDGYDVKLTTKVSRGKIHIDAVARSTFAGEMSGRISGTQGRLFQQTVSFSALYSVMLLLGISTIYVDEAFSGSSERNVRKLTSLISSLKERGINLVMIAQNTSMADGLDCNRLILTRSLDNQTTVTQEVGV